MTLLGGAWRVLLLAALLWTGMSVVLRDAAVWAAAAMTGAGLAPAMTVAVYAVALLALHEVGDLPLAFYGAVVLERRYGLSEQSVGDWLRDQSKSLALAAVLGISAAALLYSIISRIPALWWLAAGMVFALVTAGLAALGPVALLPLFYPVKRLDHEPLSRRLLTLAERAGTNVAGVYEWSISAKTRKANAALAGLGATRRILISDTMLASCSDDEIEVVLAHELGHHVYRDMWSALAIQAVILLTGFAAAAWALDTLGPVLGVSGPGDVAGLPLVALTFGASSIAALPARLAFSRFCERRADRFALEVTGNPAAFVTAMRRIAAQNLAEPRPARLVQWLFYSHPPIEERIAAAQSAGRAAGGSIVAVSR